MSSCVEVQTSANGKSSVTFKKMSTTTLLQSMPLPDNVVLLPMVSLNEAPALRLRNNTFTGAEEFGMDGDSLSAAQKEMLQQAVVFVRDVLDKGGDFSILAVCRQGANRSGLMLGFVKKSILGVETLDQDDDTLPLNNGLYRAALTLPEGLDVDPVHVKRASRMRLR